MLPTGWLGQERAPGQGSKRGLRLGLAARAGPDGHRPGAAGTWTVTGLWSSPKGGRPWLSNL